MGAMLAASDEVTRCPQPTVQSDQIKSPLTFMPMTVTVSNYLTAEFLRLVGVIAVEGAALDLFLGMLLARLTGKQEDLGYNPQYRSDTREKVKSLLAIPGLPDDLKKAANSVTAILDDRNLVIHGVITTDEAGVGRKHLGIRGRYKGREIKIDEMWLSLLAGRIANVSGVILEFYDAAAIPSTNEGS